MIWPERLDGYDWAPAYWAERRAGRGLKTPDRLPMRPTGIVIHSGATGEGTAEWAQREDGAAQFWAHFAWSSHLGRYVQTDSLHAWAPHAARLNRYSWGLETPHHPGQDGTHREETVELVRRLVELGAQWITGHRFVERTKRDPGECVTADWWDGLGLRVHWAWVGQGPLMVREGL
jgi:hypothetical protein